MRSLAWFSLLVLLVAGCAPVLQGGERARPPAEAAPGVLVISNAAGVPLLSAYLPLAAPPGSVVFEQSYTGKLSFSRFKNPQDFDAVRRYLLAALEDAGWRVLEAATWEKPPSLFQTTVRVQKDGEQKVVVLRYEDGSYSVEVREG
ncbi:hypothetical protein [Oceanithermus desulfurans]|uniref:Lipoprotein n=2 Tax=Oceanithermus desulfurans TaxID=227924 RepID=A0A511RME4_9DEIN|nr:hypothetical protein [Oceanithermus desulfurans]MBB6030983.1 hypothetical protein [Oceanithermus desulfurans]GEM90808.1 hypothetical protein ODE01S_22420 [Oceanithermus desulfurans NBRC 100063]